MTIQAKAPASVPIQFALYQADNFTRLDGQAAACEVEVWVSNADGNGKSRIDPAPVQLFELPQQAGEYVAVVAVSENDRTYSVIIRHAATNTEIEETIQTWTATPSDLAAAVADAEAAIIAEVQAVEAGYLVSLAGDPFQVDDPMQVTIQFRVQRTLALFNPADVAKVELIDRDGATVLQTRQGADIEAVGIGVRRVAFAAVANVGFYFVRTTFTPLAGGAATFDVHQVQVANLAAVAVAGVLSVEELLRDFLGALPGVDDPFDLLVEDEVDADGVVVGAKRLLPDETIAAHIRMAARDVEAFLEVPLTTRRFACRPDLVIAGVAPLKLGEDYDEEVDPLDLQWPHSGGPAALLTLPHRPVWRITRARIIYGQTVLYTLPTRWFNLNRRQGHVRLIVDSSDYEFATAAIAYTTTFGWILGAAGMRGQKWPLVWALDYEGGLPTVPDDLKALIGWRALGTLLPVAARRANRAAVQSQSASKDGVSRSTSVADGQPAGRFFALLEAATIKEWTSPDKLREKRAQHRGAAKVF